MLVEAGAPLEVATKQQLCTPLQIAAVNGCAASMTTLLEAGANLNSRRFDGATPLFLAAWEGNVDAVRLLLLAKVDPLLTPHLGTSERASLPLDVAAGLGHLEVVNELIRQVGIGGCGGSSGGVRALQQAARNKHLDMLTVLTNAGVVDTGLARGRRIWRRGPLEVSVGAGKGEENHGWTCVCEHPQRCRFDAIACWHQRCRPRVVRLLVEAGADTTSTVPIDGLPGTDNITPMGLTMLLLHDLGTEPLTEEQLNALEAIHRLLLRVEALHAVSWLWSSDICNCTYSTAQGTDRTTSKSTAGTPLVLTMRQRARSKEREVPLAALLRYSSKP
ncbi:EsV-1-199 [Ectocarpus siliculosus]|uniref:EsV-1-199 n=1 Tax=Ectocarpus siliculosus TaxID=2880 RepID=D7FXY7_ECTSI|nr:EsV-1-199 [Ectocarpus siliculosus]|eukprot:CBJ32400.1 EsV-1-199 [Ectocarpus siliculosus]